MSRRAKNANLTYDFYNKTLHVEWKDNENKKSGEMYWIIYARVSTEEQKRKGDGIWWQITDCKKRARVNNVKIVCEPFIDEAVSWTKLNRKWFNAAMAFVEQENKFRHKIDYFICSSTSRFSRSKMMNENFELIWKLNALWVQLVAVWNWGIQEVETEKMNNNINNEEKKVIQKEEIKMEKGKIDKIKEKSGIRRSHGRTVWRKVRYPGCGTDSRNHLRKD